MRVAYRESISEDTEKEMEFEKTIGGAHMYCKLKIRIESTIDEVAIDLIRRLVDIGIDINKKEFYGDLAMITELVRGLIYRDFKREHLATVLIDKIIDIQYNEKGEVQPVINYSRVLEQKDMPGQEGEKEIHFEPDFEIPIPPEDDDK